MLYEFGLTEVADKDLKTLLQYLHRGEMNFPLTPAELARFGLQRCSASLLGQLRGLESDGVRAVVVAVLAERIEAQKAAAKALALVPGD